MVKGTFGYGGHLGYLGCGVALQVPGESPAAVHRTLEPINLTVLGLRVQGLKVWGLGLIRA